MAIHWGDLPFTEPAIFNGSVPSTESGIYAIMTKPDPREKPNTYRVMYFGETDNFSKRLGVGHEKAGCWKQNMISGLYYELYKMLGSTQDQRQTIESILIKTYSPVCNEKP